MHAQPVLFPGDAIWRYSDLLFRLRGLRCLCLRSARSLCSSVCAPRALARSNRLEAFWQGHVHLSGQTDGRVASIRGPSRGPSFVSDFHLFLLVTFISQPSPTLLNRSQCLTLLTYSTTPSVLWVTPRLSGWTGSPSRRALSAICVSPRARVVTKFGQIGRAHV